jgi:hypothetical protein
MKTKNDIFEKVRAKKALNLLAAALPVVLAACGAAEPTEDVGGSSGSVSSSPVTSCVPLNQQIPFSITNAYVASRKLYAGSIPGYQNVGTVAIGGSVAAGGVYQGNGLDSSVLSMNLTPTGSTTTSSSYGSSSDWLSYQSYANAAGYLQVGPTLQQQAALLVQLGYISIPGLSTSSVGTTSSWMTPSASMPSQTVSISPSQLCVSSLAISINVLPGSTTLYIGDVYVYLNNTQHGFSIDF